MYPKLPPLNALRTFESAARHVSFSLAAKELFVTHGAVSKQVKGLETYLGLSLFIRQHKGLRLTDEGIRYLTHIQSALQTINDATVDIQSQLLRAQSLAINVLPSLSISCLIPCLENFKSSHPNLYVDLSIGDFPIDFSQSHYDIAIRSATSAPQGVNFIKLMDEDLCLVCSPQLASEMSTLADINEMTLLKHTLRPNMWHEWSQAVGVVLSTDKKFGMAHFYMLSQAAVSSMGVALIPRFFIEQQLKEGSLVIPFSLSFTSPYCYYLLTPKSSNYSFKVQLFINWILDVFAPYRKISAEGCV
ncbi:LysR substrate-binding domain-containing protein [Psychromonas antarctica]|uniref:LysR substrate-binding domain-containing protein n=1 Tax=Psychromonas antarctica TaxID=67573 RepID=UPI001EE95453|nr:LysR substrate-binding domain-containing protein [Psychromonas antarctica]MCG6201521.1 LysR substrate-binding domain-containing protein [Psychromonas antarctica]